MKERQGKGKKKKKRQKLQAFCDETKVSEKEKI
jgi:hypothetical protein